MPAKPRTISLYPPDDLRKKLEAEAKLHMRSINNMMVLILAKYFREKATEASDNGTR